MKWIKRILISLIGIYLFALGVDIFVSRSLLSSNLFSSELSVWKDIYDKKIDKDLVIYGSSRSYVHINPNILDRDLELNSYNLGFNGQKIELQKYRHKILLSKGIIPDNVIINLDINSLCTVETFSAEQFIPLLFFNNNLYQIVKKDIKLRKVDVYIPLIRYRKFNLKTKNLIKEIYKIYVYSNYKHSNRIKGFTGISLDWKENDNLSYEIIIDSVRKNELLDIIKDLKQVNSNIILINSPEYYTQIQSQVNREEIIDLYKSIANRYNIPFLDYSDDSINYRKELFYNSNHLNAKGADIFTKKLAEDIKPFIKR